MVASNQELYSPNEHPDHCVVIKYVPYVGDSKRAMDEYTSELMLGGHSTIVIHNTCEDSLLAAPIILDLVILAEMCERIEYSVDDEEGVAGVYEKFNSVLSLLSYLCKAPLVPSGAPVVNALFRQRACIENVFRACLGLTPASHMSLEMKREEMSHRYSRRAGAVNATSTTAAGGQVSNSCSVAADIVALKAKAKAVVNGNGYANQAAMETVEK